MRFCAGSEVHMMSEASKHARERELATGPRLNNLKIKHRKLCSFGFAEFVQTGPNFLAASVLIGAESVRHSKIRLRKRFHYGGQMLESGLYLGDCVCHLNIARYDETFVTSL